MKILNKKKEKFFSRKVFFLLFVVSFLNFFLIINTNGIGRDIYNEISIYLKLPYLINKEVSQISVKDDLKIISKNISSGILHIFEKDKFEKISLDISFANFQKILENRASTLTQEKDRQFLSEKTKVKAKLSYRDKTYPVTVRLKGDRADHYAASSKISLDIEFAEGSSVFGFKRFSLQSHISRQFPENEVLSNFLADNGIIAPKFKTVNLSVNGDNWGQMYLEESISSSFFENRKIKETPVARFTNQEKQKIASKFKKKYNVQDIENFFNLYGKFETRIYEESKYKKNFLSSSMISTMRLIHDNFNNKDLFNIDYSKKLIINKIDLKKFSNLLALSTVINNWHATTYTNLKFYFNPYSGLIEPMPTDFIMTNESFKNIDHFKKVFLTNTNDFYFKIINNKKFIESYFNFVEKISNSINILEENIQILCKDFNVVDCGNNFNSQILKVNSRFILEHRDAIENLFKKNENELIALSRSNFLRVDNSRILKNDKEFLDLSRKILDNYIYARAFSDGSFFIKNISPFEININEIKMKFKEKIDDDFKNYNLKNKFICTNDIPINKKIISGSVINFNFNLQNELKKCFKYASSIEINFNEKAKSLITKTDIENFIFKEFRTIDRLKNVKEYIKGKNVILKKGTYFFDQPLILPNDYSLIIEKGAKLLFSTNSYIYIDGGDIQINGTKSEPVLLIPKNNHNSWRGIHVKNSHDSYINHAHFKKLNYFYSKELLIFLTGGINFYESKVQFINSQFTDSFSEDFINLINTEFEVNKIVVKNSHSDAIDLDYSNGNLNNILFYNIGGDAVDTSGSKTVIRNMNAIKVADKSISLGENSVSFVENSRFSESKFGIAVKDGSKLRSKNLEFFKNKYDIASYKKKSFYPGTNEMYIETASKDLKIFNDSSSNMYVNQKKININNFKRSEIE